MPSRDTPSRKKPRKRPTQPSPSTGEFTLTSPGEFVVTHKGKPAKPPEGKRIHPRRPLPLVPQARPEPLEDEEKPA